MKALLLAVLSLGCVGGEGGEGGPRFSSREGHHETRLGQTVHLPCSVENLGDSVVMWRKTGARGEGLLFVAESRMTDDDRYELLHETATQWDLVIKDVERMDSRVFLCQVSTDPVLNQSQLLNVLAPPQVNMVPDYSPFQVKPGDNAVLTCHSAGNPQPTVSWRRKDGALLPTGSASSVGHRLELVSVGAGASGEYECEARNSVGSVRKTLLLSVISTENEKDEKIEPWVQAGEEYVPVAAGTPEVNLSCRYRGNPEPKIDWIRNGERIQMLMRKDGDYTETTLRISRVSAEDFGDYVCRVHNTLGSKEAKIFLSGLPGVASVRGRVSGSVVEVAFQLGSPEPLLGYRLQFRRSQEDVWTTRDLSVAAGDQRNATWWSGEAKLEALQPDTEYLIQVSGKNAHGWGLLPPAPLKLRTAAAPKARPSSAEDNRPTRPTVKDKAGSGGSRLGLSLLLLLAPALLAALLS